MNIETTMKLVDKSIKSVERKRPEYWCQNCELGLHSHEVDITRVTDTYEFWGERGTYDTVEITCGGCGQDVEDYDGQDYVEDEE